MNYDFNYDYNKEYALFIHTRKIPNTSYYLMIIGKNCESKSPFANSYIHIVFANTFFKKYAYSINIYTDEKINMDNFKDYCKKLISSQVSFMSEVEMLEVLKDIAFCIFQVKRVYLCLQSSETKSVITSGSCRNFDNLKYTWDKVKNRRFWNEIPNLERNYYGDIDWFSEFFLPIL
ncbi:MAG: hypothetical protein IJ809_04420 [Clostridia bacterium]|nr:hypothetical protein [Clostridia bacterium]